MAVYPTMTGLLEDKNGLLVSACREIKTVPIYKIRLFRRDSPAAVIAPHGGKIEHGTTPIAEKIAGDQYNFFSFEGDMTDKNHKTLHVTSTRYDAPDCLNLISTCSFVVTIHGAADAKTDDLTVYIGGRNKRYRTAVQNALNNIGALRLGTLQTGIHPNPDLQGTDPSNICNRGNNPDGGVQLELSSTLRTRLVQHDAGPDDDLSKFAMVIRGVIKETVGQ